MTPRGRFVLVLACVVGAVAHGLLAFTVTGQTAGTFPDRGTPSSYAALRSELVTGMPVATGDRSIPLAFALSAAVPGAGQAYNRQWIKAAIGFGAEVALIAGYVIIRQDGLDREAAFQQFAHQRWSPARYGMWVNDYKAFLNQEYSAGISAPDVAIPAGIDFTQPDAWTAAESMAVDELIAEIRGIERDAFHPETGAAFSHQLPGFAEQQYYELIGKYFQFAPGWDDYPDWVDTDGAFTVAIDPEHTGPGGSKPNVSTTFRSYAKDHAKAQDVLRSASRMSFFFILNHVVAGIDAAVNAKLHNDRLSTRMGVSTAVDGTPVAYTSLRLRF